MGKSTTVSHRIYDNLLTIIGDQLALDWVGDVLDATAFFYFFSSDSYFRILNANQRNSGSRYPEHYGMRVRWYNESLS